MTRPLLLDTFCCQGGAAMGYHRAGFDILGVDINPQPHYPFEFQQGGAIAVLHEIANSGGYWRGRGIAAIHASPPCQAHSKAQRIRGSTHPRLIGPTRSLLERIGVPWVIENVEGARDDLRDPVMLCGAMFPELRTYRHRLFETSWPLCVPTHPVHVARLRKMGRPPQPGEFMHVVGNFSGVALARVAMGIEWATRDGLREAIPPAYTEFIGRQLLEQLPETVDHWWATSNNGHTACVRCGGGWNARLTPCGAA